MQAYKQTGILQTSLIHSRKFRKYTSYRTFAELEVGQLSDSRMPDACHFPLVTRNHNPNSSGPCVIAAHQAMAATIAITAKQQKESIRPSTDSIADHT